MNNHTLRRLALLILMLSLILLAAYTFREEFELQKLKTLIESFGIWAPLAYILIYISAILFLLPGSALTILGGLIFGPWLGVLFSMISAVTGGSIAFLIARYIAQDWAAKKTGGKLKKLIEGVEKEGWKFVAVMRLMPIVPFTLLNYALGLTRVSLFTYVIASSIFMLPGCFAYTYVGSLGLVAIEGEAKELVTKGLLGIGFLVFLSVLPWIIRKLKNGKS